MIKFGLALQTPTVIIPIVAKDAAGNKDTFSAEFKRYNLEGIKVKLEEYDALFHQFNKLQEDLQNEVSGSEEILAKYKAALAKATDDLQEALSKFVRKELVSFRDIKCRKDGKVVCVIKDTETEGDDPDQWGEATNCTSAWFDLFWTSRPYRDAIRDGMLSAIRNVPE